MRPTSQSRAFTRPTLPLVVLTAALALGAAAAQGAVGDLRLRGGCSIEMPHAWPNFVSFGLDAVTRPTFEFQVSNKRMLTAGFREVGLGTERHFEAGVALESLASIWTGPIILAEDRSANAVTGTTVEFDFEDVHCAATVVEKATTAYHDPYAPVPFAVADARVAIGVTLPDLEACALEIAFDPEYRTGKLAALIQGLEVHVEASHHELPFVADEAAGTLTVILTERAWYDRIFIEAKGGEGRSLLTQIKNALYPRTADDFEPQALLRVARCPE